ncbi:MAG: Fic family protein [Saprospiraceae bacterium]|nr:Fic family protein [Saprospiraceae bacterium]
MIYLYQREDWPNFTWKEDKIINLLAEVRNLQGRILGRMESLGFELRQEATLETITLDVLKSSEIEGEILNPAQVRSSIARRIGMELAGAVPSDRDVDGIVEMMIDATQNCYDPISAERLFDWHAALFPTGRSGLYKIKVADWRLDDAGPMQVVSRTLGKEKIHFQAPDAILVANEMNQFIDWFNSQLEIDGVLKAAVAHLWFITIHPFADGNGRIARALTDMLLARADRSKQRFYSISAQIRTDRTPYYEILEQTQKGQMDITLWLLWFLNCLKSAFYSTDAVLDKVLFKADFWKKNIAVLMNERQQKMINKILDHFEGKLTSDKWAKLCKCSKDTAIRDINDLIEKNILCKEDAGGRSTHYVLNN